MGSSFLLFVSTQAAEFKPGKVDPTQRSREVDSSLATFINQRGNVTDWSLVVLVRGEAHHILNQQGNRALASEPVQTGDWILLDETATSFLGWRRANPTAEVKVFWATHPPAQNQALRYTRAAGEGSDSMPPETAKTSPVSAPADVALYDTAAAAWERTVTGQPSTQVMAKLFAAMSQAWEQNTELVRDSKAYDFARAAVVTAKVLAEDSQMEESALILKKAAEVMRDYGVDVTRGRGGSHLQEVAGVHVKVWNATGKDPFVGTAMAYELMREGDHFVVIQEGKKTDSSELLDGGLFLPNEKEGKLLHLNSAGTVLQACPVAITPGVGSLRSRLSAIFEQQPSEAGGPSRYARSTVETFFAPQAGATGSPSPRAILEKVEQAWQAAKQSTYARAPVKAVAVAEAGAAWKDRLRSDPSTAAASQEKIADELVDFVTALAWAKAGDYERAVESLAAEAATQTARKRALLENTRQPEVFARDVFSLHSLLLAHTPKAKSLQNLGYEFFEIKTTPNKKAFIFVYGSDGEFQSDFTTEGVEASEQKKMIYLYEPDLQGKYGVVDRAQVIADRVRFTVSARQEGHASYLVLGGIQKVIEYLPKSGYPEVKVSRLNQIQLRIEAGKIERPLAAMERMISIKPVKGPSAISNRR